MSGVSSGVGSWGPIKGRGGVEGQSPGGVQGAVPPEALGFKLALVKGPERLSWKYMFL